MNRWIISLSLALLVACQTGSSETTQVEQTATSGDCVPGGNFVGAKTGPLPMWDGKQPVVGPGQIVLDVEDWRADTTTTGTGFHVAVVADPGTGTFVWGATIEDSKLGTFRTPPQGSSPGGFPRIPDCCLPPPCCRGCCDDWMAPNLLEAALRYIVVPQNAFDANGLPKKQ